jgi:hypothetical protein
LNHLRELLHRLLLRRRHVLADARHGLRQLLHALGEHRIEVLAR